MVTLRRVADFARMPRDGAIIYGDLIGKLALATFMAAALLSASRVAADSTRPNPLNTIAEVGASLHACWLPPPIDQAKPGMQITVIVSFNRMGNIIGDPRFSYSSPDATATQRAVYKRAAVEALNRCTPLHFTPALGGALAGRPFAIRFFDNRGVRSAGRNA